VKQRIIRTGSAEPALAITLEQAKSHLRVTEDYEDSLIVTDINGAIEWAEERTRRAITQRSFLVVADAFPVSMWALPLGKIQSITSIEYKDADGITQAWNASPAEYELDNDSDFQARLRPRTGFSWPTTGTYLSAARLTVVAGWPSDDVPYTVRQGILLKIGDLFERRAPGDWETPDNRESIEEAAEALLSGWTLPPF